MIPEAERSAVSLLPRQRMPWKAGATDLQVVQEFGKNSRCTRGLCFLYNPGPQSNLRCWEWPDLQVTGAYLLMLANSRDLQFYSSCSNGESRFSLTTPSLYYMYLVIEEPNGEILWLLAATTGRIQNDRNLVTVALQLITSMENMPFTRIASCLRKCKTKTAINHKKLLYRLLFDWKKKDNPTHPQIKNPSNQPRTSLSQLVLFPHSLKWRKNSLSKNSLEYLVSSFCTCPGILTTCPSILPTCSSTPPVWIHRLLPPLLLMFKTFFHIFFSIKIESNPEICTIYPHWVLIN